ncbi:MAG: T9SS type A sorting domain-containing protein [Saprospiraceae bacterium]|nr:T9SS type A sorting domain-containing protein [Saprospiraceae bacterium]
MGTNLILFLELIVDGNLKESITINSSLTPAEILKNSDEKSSIYLEFIDEIAQFQLLQNVPNPFTYNTLIKYFSPKKEIIKWNVLNLSGQKIIQGNLESQIGMNDFEIKSEDLTTSGAYILQLITASGIFSQKIIFIKQ